MTSPPAPDAPPRAPSRADQYSQLLAGLGGIVWEADAATFQMTFVSESAERLLGYPVWRWLEPNFWADHIHPDDHAWATEFCRQATRDKRPHDFEYRMTAADGRTVWLRDIVTVVVEGGVPTKLRGVIVDVTERKAAEEEHQQHVHFLESLDRVNVAIQGSTHLERMSQDVLDVFLDIFDCDRAWLLTPFDPSATATQVVMERTTPQYSGTAVVGAELKVDEWVSDSTRDRMADGEPVSFGPDGDFPVPEPVRTAYGIQSSLAMLVLPKGTAPHVFGVHQCSHTRVWTSQERRLFQEVGRRLADALSASLSYRQLRDSESRFRVLVDHATDAFFLHATDGTILDVNRQACDALGYSADELIGMNPGVFDAGVGRGEVERFATRLDAGEVLTYETRHRRKDGTEFPVELRVRPFWEGGRRFAVSLARDITERKKAEEALAARDTVLRSLAESSPGMMGTYHLRPDGSVCAPYSSPRIWDLYGLRPEDVRDDATPLLNRTHPDDAAGVRESIAESARTMTPWRHEYRVVHPTRGELWVEGNSTPRPHPAGGVIWYGFVNDITDRKRAEAAVRKSEELYRLLTENSNDLVYLLDLDGQVVYASPSVGRLLGLVPRATFEAVHPTDLPAAREYWERVRAGVAERMTFRVRDAGGGWHALEAFSSLVHHQGGALVLSVCHDITLSERALAALRASEQRLRAIVDTEPECVKLLGPAGELLEMNPAGLRMVEADSPDEVQNRCIYPRVAEEYRPAFRELNERVFAGGAGVLEFELIGLKGGRRWLETHATPLRDEAGRVVAALSVTRDITARKRVEEALRRSEATLTRAQAVAHVGSWDLDLTRNELRWSDETYRVFGIPRGTPLTYQTFLAAVHPDDRPAVERAWTAAMRGEPYDVEHRIVVGGEVRWVREKAELERDASGHAVSGVGITHDITDRKRAEESRRLVEERFRLVWSHSGDGMRLTDADGTILMVNDAYCQLVGLPRESLEGQHLAVVQLPESRERVLHLHRERFASRTVPARMQRSLTLWNGNQVWVELTNTFLGSSQPLLLSVFRDISERKRAEMALRESERRLESAQQIAHVGYWDRDHVADRITLSSETRRIFGVGPEERFPDITSWVNRWQGVTHPDDRARVLQALTTAIGGGPRYDVEYRVARPGGDELVVRSQGDVTSDAAGRAVRMFGTMQDITELREVERELRASEVRFRTLVDHAADAFFLMDARSVVLDVNRQACQCLGYTREELIGKCPLDFDPAVDRTRLDQMLARLDAGELLEFETEHRRKDGTAFPVEIRVRPFWEGGKRFAVALARDVTDRKWLEEEFRQAQKMEAVGRLAGGVAHDFNNLLTVINGYSEMMFNGLPAGDPNRVLAAEVQKAGERAATLTRQLLAFSRKQVLQPQFVSLNAILGDLAKLLRRLIGEDIELALRLDPNLGVVRVDPGQFEQAVINLAVNARDAMPDGGRITIATRNVELDHPVAAHPEVRPGPYVLVTVADTGHGMDEGTLRRIFEPFFTTKEQGKGTGLGLAMVYGFVKQTDGHIEVVSEVGRGTTFRVYLPRAETVTPTTRAAAQSEFAMPTGTETVLLVEDDTSVRALAHTILQTCGYTVLEARDGEEGLAVAAAHPGAIALLVTDLIMPRVGGRRLAEQVREIRPGVRVLFLSGYTHDTVLAQGLNAPEVTFLQKPFTVSGLARTVRQVLDASPP